MTDAILGLYPSEPPEIPLRAIKYSPNVTLSFVLLNEDAAEGKYAQGWDIEAAIRGRPCRRRGAHVLDHFAPHLDALRPVFNFTIESQVLYHAPLSFEPTWGDLPVQTDEAQRRISAAVDRATKGDEGAEDVAKALLAEEAREKAWFIDEEMMKVFVNSEHWTLGEFA
jgi:phosphatidylinositol glycan class S